ncbi:hypothetical protein J3F83DRAFT_743381 [Trichoderma novae-zelandiae]
MYLHMQPSKANESSSMSCSWLAWRWSHHSKLEPAGHSVHDNGALWSGPRQVGGKRGRKRGGDTHIPMSRKGNKKEGLKLPCFAILDEPVPFSKHARNGLSHALPFEKTSNAHGTMPDARCSNVSTSSSVLASADPQRCDAIPLPRQVRRERGETTWRADSFLFLPRLTYFTCAWSPKVSQRIAPCIHPISAFLFPHVDPLDGWMLLAQSWLFSSCHHAVSGNTLRALLPGRGS